MQSQWRREASALQLRSLVAPSFWLPECGYGGLLHCARAHMLHVCPLAAHALTAQQHGQVTAARDACLQWPSSLPLLLSSLLQVDRSPAHVNVMLAQMFLSFGSRLQMHFQHSVAITSSAACLAPQWCPAGAHCQLPYPILCDFKMVCGGSCTWPNALLHHLLSILDPTSLSSASVES